MAVQDLVLTFIYDDESGEKQFYIPGDLLRGNIHLDLRRGLRLRSLTLIILGGAAVSWEEPAKKKMYNAREEYLQGTKVLMDAGMEDSVEFSRGIHKFSFSYQLPDTLPSSFSGIYGSVSYIAKVVLNAEDESCTTVTSEPFMVLRRPLLPPSAFAEKEEQTSKFFLGILNSGKIKVRCRISRSAAIPGEIIYVNAQVTNSSPRSITLIQAAVILESTYYAHNVKGKKIVFRQVLNKRIDVFDVNDRWERRWRNVQMAIPPYLPDSGLEKCSIMDIKYMMEFRAQIQDHDDVLVTFPLFVGGYPEVMSYDEKETDYYPPEVLGGPRNIRLRDDFSYARDMPWYGGNRAGAMTESLDGDDLDIRKWT